jgi:hypothetical protein
MAMLPIMGPLFSPGGGASFDSQAPTAPTTPSLGKNSVQQNIGSPHTGFRTTITKGEPLSRAMGQYGKGHSFSSPANTAGSSPLKQIRGGSGQMRRIRGGLGPGKTGTAGPSNTDYSMSSGDTE